MGSGSDFPISNLDLLVNKSDKRVCNESKSDFRSRRPHGYKMTKPIIEKRVRQFYNKVAMSN